MQLSETWIELLISCGLGLLVFAVGALLAFIWRKWIGPALIKAAEKLHQDVLAEIERAFLKPFFYSILLISLSIALTLPELDFLRSAPWLTLRQKCLAIGIIVLLTWGALGVCQVIPAIIRRFSDRFELGTGKAFIRFLTYLCRVVVILISISIIFDALGYNINGVLTGLGLGGLSFALAAQELLTNIFGGFVLVMEKPFEIGDWITTPDTEGTVEDIALRATKIRTIEGALMVVPNSKLVSGTITNSARINRRLGRFTLGIEYSTPVDAIKDVIADLREVLSSHPDIYPETVQVQLSEFAASSISIYVQFNTRTADIVKHRLILEDVNLKITAILSKHHVNLAFPSQTIYFSKGGSSD